MDFSCKCDKCGTGVVPENDALALGVLVRKMEKYGLDFKEEELDEEGRWMNTAFFAQGSRHLLPVVDGGKVICPGSPSRAQYLEGQPRDERGFPYDPTHESVVRAAYARMTTSS